MPQWVTLVIEMIKRFISNKLKHEINKQVSEKLEFFLYTLR
jgi:hypothetical protein